jgi:hypothetical protein
LSQRTFSARWRHIASLQIGVTESQEHEGLDLSQHGESALASSGFYVSGNGRNNVVASEPMVGAGA